MSQRGGSGGAVADETASRQSPEQLDKSQGPKKEGKSRGRERKGVFVNERGLIVQAGATGKKQKQRQRQREEEEEEEAQCDG